MFGLRSVIKACTSRGSKLLLLALLALLSNVAVVGSPAHADDEPLLLFTVPPGSAVFFGDFLSTSASGEDAVYRIRAWDDGTERVALISEETFTYLPYELLEGNVPFRRFDRASGPNVTVTVADDFSQGTVEADFSEVGRVTATLSAWFQNQARTMYVGSGETMADWDLFSPSIGLADHCCLSASGSIHGRSIIGHAFDVTYGRDVTGWGYIVGPRLY